MLKLIISNKGRQYRFSIVKNEQLKVRHGVCFEDIIDAIDAGALLASVDHHNFKKYAHQQLYVVFFKEYVYLVPCLRESSDCVFLKTVIPSRKAKKTYLEKRKLS